MKKFSLVIPVFQTPGILRLFLESLEKTLEYESQIIFIDDASPKESKKLLVNFKDKNHSHDIIIITHQTCKGCVYNINKAFNLVYGEYTVMLDSDIILNTGWQSKLLDTFEMSKNVGAIGAKLVYPQSRGIQNCGLVFSECMIKHLFFLSSQSSIKETEKLIKVQSTVFAFCAIPTRIIHEIGKLDNQFFNGNEDVDYQLRIGKKGYNIYVNTEIEVLHWEKSNGIHRKFNQRNNLCNIWKKHSDFIRPDLFDFITKRLSSLISSSEDFVLVDFSESKVDSNKLILLLKENFSLLAVDDFSYCCNASNPIWLPELLYGDYLCLIKRYIFLCDTFIQLCENQYWHDLRKPINDNDLIIDFNGNVILFSELEKTFWPNRKYR